MKKIQVPLAELIAFAEEMYSEGYHMGRRSGDEEYYKRMVYDFFYLDEPTDDDQLAGESYETR